VIEKTPGNGPCPQQIWRSGRAIFLSGSLQSRAAARAAIEKRRRPKHPPSFTLDLSSESIERCRELYRAVAFRRYPVQDGMPYIQILFPKGVTADDEQAPVNGKQNGPDVGEQTGFQTAPINRSLYEYISK
jgi:hypothetical protein